MKKLSFLMAVIVSLTMIFTACETPTTGGNGKLTIDVENAEEISNLRLYYQGPIAPYFPGFAEFTFEAYTGTVDYNPTSDALEGDGLVIQVTQALSYHDNMFPISKQYTPFEVVNGQVADIYPGGAVAVYAYIIENGEVNTDASLKTQDFKVEYIGDANNMTFAVEADFNGEHRVYLFEGKALLENYSSFVVEDIETEEVYNGSVEYASAEVIYYGESAGLLPLNVIEVVLVNNNNTVLGDFYCYGSLENKTNVYGTYTVANEYAEGTMAKSPGLYMVEDGSMVFPSFIARNYDAQSGAADFYLVNAGSLTIEEGKISFDITSLNGSKITTNFEGNISVKSYDEAYPNNAPRSKSPAKMVQPLNYNPVKLF